MRRDGKGQPHIHPGGIALDGRIHKLLDLGKVDDLVELAVDLGLLHAEDGAVEIDVLAPGELGMEAGADLQQAADAALDLDLAAGGGGDARQDFEQGALAGAVAADDAKDLALADLEADVAQGPQLAADAVAVVGLADLEQGVGPAAGLGPPAVEVLAQGAAADEAEAVVLAEVFDLDDDGHGFGVRGS